MKSSLRRRLSAVLAAICLVGTPAVARADAGRLRLEVEVVEDGRVTETRVVHLDLHGTHRRNQEEHLAILWALAVAGGAMAVWMWSGRRRPKPIPATRNF